MGRSDAGTQYLWASAVDSTLIEGWQGACILSGITQELQELEIQRKIGMLQVLLGGIVSILLVTNECMMPHSKYNAFYNANKYTNLTIQTNMHTSQCKQL